MHPVLVTGPTEPAVGLPELKSWCRVDHDDEDALITSIGLAATAHLDGWRGVLGRAIRSQTWQQEFTACTVSWAEQGLRLALPDVTAAVVSVRDDDGDAWTPVTEGLRIVETANGPLVFLPGDLSYRDAQVNFTCQLPAELLPAAQTAIGMLAAHWYQNREAVGVAGQSVPMGAEALIRALVWRCTW